MKNCCIQAVPIHKHIKHILHQFPTICTTRLIGIFLIIIIIPCTISSYYNTANVIYSAFSQVVQHRKTLLQSLSLVFRVFRCSRLTSFGVKDADSTILLFENPVGIEKCFFVAFFAEITNGKPILTAISILKPPFYTILTLKILVKALFRFSASIVLPQEERMQQAFLLRQLIMFFCIRIHLLQYKRNTLPLSVFLSALT